MGQIISYFLSYFKPDHEKNNYYVLHSDFSGTTRLALQNYIWREALGWSIHPRIALPDNAKIADIAAGTTLWLRDVARELGSNVSTLDAFDIHLKQAPPKGWLPPSMNLFEWNIFEEPPEECLGKYDLIHVRLITVAMKDNDPGALMKRFSKLLKPGGWLQWDEVDVSGSFVVKSPTDLKVPDMDHWCKGMVNSQTAVAKLWHSDEGVVDKLDSNGFDHAEKHDCSAAFTKQETLPLMRYNSDQLLMLSEQYARRVLKGEELIKRLKMVNDAAKDAEKGSAMIMPPLVFTAKKKLA